MNSISKIFTMIVDPKTVRELIRFRFGDYLLETGWIESIRRREAVDAAGNPLPWMTLPFIHFLDRRLHSSLSLFEFGSGNSTKYFARKVGTIRSVEHDAEWYTRFHKDELRGLINHQPLDETDRYERSALASGKKYDIIVVDGRRRVQCIVHSIHALRDGGVFIFDDSERDEYAEGIKVLTDSGFKRLDFWGMAPGMHAGKCTSVFYRSVNCLGI